MPRLKISELCTAQNRTMDDLALQMRCDPQTVYMWNQGRSVPRLPTFVRLMRALKCTWDQIIDDIGGAETDEEATKRIDDARFYN